VVILFKAAVTCFSLQVADEQKCATVELVELPAAVHGIFHLNVVISDVCCQDPVDKAGDAV